jgi:beta-galactosidase
MFHMAEFNITHVADTFLNPKGWTHGQAWVNGFNIGTYWATKGPQLTLYVPAGLLNVGRNCLVIFEFEEEPEGSDKWMTLDDKPQLSI